MVKKTPELTATEVVEFVKKQQTLTEVLRTRMEDHADFLRNDWFIMPGVHPENYQIMPTIRPLAFKNKLTSEIASGIIKRCIPYVAKESNVEKANITLTERTSYGLTALANDRLQSLLLPPIRMQVADDIAYRGWVGERVWLYEEKERGETKLIVDIAIWDVRNVYWAIGKNGLNCACNVRYITEEEIKESYPKAHGYAVDSKGQVLLYDWWDDQWELVVIGDEIVDSQWHDRGYPPIYIMPVGPSRQRQSSKHDDTLKYVGEDFAANGGDIAWKTLSRAMSYFLTTTALGTHPQQKMFYNGPENLPIFADPKSLWESGAFIPLDKSKGQDVEPMFKPTLPAEAFNLLSIAGTEVDLASASGAFFGNIPANTTAQATAMIIHASMGVLKNGKLAREQQDSWEANEETRQFKDGKFADVQLHGVDGKEKQFDITPNRDKLVTNRRIISELMLDVTQETMEKIDQGATLKKLGWISDQTGMDKFAGVADPDAESERIAYERAVQLTGADDWKVLDQAVREGDKITAWRVWSRINQEVQQAKQMAQGQPADISALGQMDMMPTKPQLPSRGMPRGEMQTAGGEVNARLANIGMVRGR